VSRPIPPSPANDPHICVLSANSAPRAPASPPHYHCHLGPGGHLLSVTDPAPHPAHRQAGPLPVLPHARIEVTDGWTPVLGLVFSAPDGFCCEDLPDLLASAVHQGLVRPVHIYMWLPPPLGQRISSSLAENPMHHRHQEPRHGRAERRRMVAAASRDRPRHSSDLGVWPGGFTED
jgi:hypothetical protein